MTTVSSIKAILEADATLLATATGGVWDYNETGREGLNRTINPDAFDSDGIIKPCIVVVLRSSTPNYILQDDDGQYQSVVDVIELVFYADSSYTPINTMLDRCYALLHTARPSGGGAFAVRWAGDVRGQRDATLDALVEASTYQVTRYISV